MRTQTVEAIEMEITAVQNEMKGMDRMSAAYFNMEAKLEQLYYSLDDMAAEMKVTEEQISQIKGSRIVANLFNVKKSGQGIYTVADFKYGVEQPVIKVGTALDVAQWINQYTGHGGG